MKPVRKTALRLALLIAALTLSACNSSFRSDALEPGELGSDISAIGMLPVNWQERYEMKVFGNAVTLLGTTGMAVVEKGRETRSRKLTEALEGANYDYRSDFLLALGAALQSEGIGLEELAYQRRPHPQAGRMLKGHFEYEEYYPVGRNDYPALLDIYIEFVGVGSEGITTDFNPTLYVGVRLVDGADGSVLYQQLIEYNSFAKEDEEIVRLGPDADYTFENFEDVMANIPRVREGLREAVQAVTDRIAADLGNARR